MKKENRKEKMKFNVQIRADVPNTFAKKNGDKVNERLLTCIDLTPDAFVSETFEVLADNLPFNEAGSLIGRPPDWSPRPRRCADVCWWQKTTPSTSA